MLLADHHPKGIERRNQPHHRATPLQLTGYRHPSDDAAPYPLAARAEPFLGIVTPRS